MTVITHAVHSVDHRENPEVRRPRPINSSFHSALSAARREIVMVRSDAMPRPDELRREAALLTNLLRRWVRISVIWDERLLSRPAIVEYVLWQARSGIQVRTAARVPVTMALVDDTTSAVVAEPVQDAPRGEEEVSVSRCPDTVGMLHYLFLGLWEGSTSLAVENWSPDDDQSQDVLRMLARGHTDEQIAHRLDVSKRTVSRTVAKLMRELNARSRFEAGVLATRLGWFGTPDRRG
ncbi:helix-turn-helix transcriptional regulator [Streptomyces hygroscopicus]|uniref:helix-turn-helix transcriptional regulator n=1 Tax=Streptomyces hygroscopicus TaxID=1912 RepID=UPI0033C384FC